MPKQGYSKPKLFNYAGDLSKEWYVGFRFTCPKRQIRKPVQVRLGINYVRTVVDREAEGKAVLKIVERCLKDGWNPQDENIETYLKRQNEATEPEPAPHDDLLIDYSTMTFNEALTHALAEKKKALKKRSIPEYKSIHKFATHAAKIIGLDKFKIGDVKKVHIKKLLEQISKDRQAAYDKQGKGKIFTPNAYNKYKKNLSALWSELDEWDAVEYNPCEKLKTKDKIETGIHRHATDEELKILKARLQADLPQLYAFLRFEFVTGMRPSEILDTTFNMVDWLNSCIKLSDIKVIRNKDGETISKTTSYRMVPVPAFLLDWLKKRAAPYPGHYYIFSRNLMPGTHKHAQNWISRLWEREVKKKMGINVSLYSFKGLGGDAKRDAGIPLEGVMVGYGHTKPSTTKIYLKKEGERLRKQIITAAPDL